MFQGQREACKILGVSPYATKDEIKKAYRNMCKIYHPDRNSDPKAKKVYLEVQQAYRLLSQQELQIKKPNIFYYQAPQTTKPCRKIIGGNPKDRERSNLREETARKLRQERHKRLKEQEEKKKRELEKRLAARKLPSEREAEKRRKIEVQKEAERIANIIQTLMNMET
ncbi:MAG: J domain-containing protein [Lachnospiraceae bacterium]|nr:J domain-containing protein [Lachnospiraceae bacterium]